MTRLWAGWWVWAAEAGVAFDLAEIALAHDVGNATSRAYRRSDALDRRRPVMDRWAQALIGTGGAVVQLRS